MFKYSRRFGAHDNIMLYNRGHFFFKIFLPLLPLHFCHSLPLRFMFYVFLAINFLIGRYFGQSQQLIDFHASFVMLNSNLSRTGSHFIPMTSTSVKYLPLTKLADVFWTRWSCLCRYDGPEQGPRRVDRADWRVGIVRVCSMFSVPVCWCRCFLHLLVPF